MNIAQWMICLSILTFYVAPAKMQRDKKQGRQRLRISAGL